MSDSPNRERYFFLDQGVPADPISGEVPIKLKYHAGGQWKQSVTETYMPCYNPSTGAVIALAPQCTSGEVEEAVEAAKAAFPGWSTTPVSKRVQVLYRMKALLDENLEELTVLLAKEMSKKYQEAMGDILKVTEVVEFACGAPHIMKGEALMQVSTNYDTALYREPMGVFAGIPPWNFPAMIPHGWMTPICVATGNCMVLKAASFVPQSAMRVMELWQEAGMPDGVINVVTAGRDQAELLLRHPDIKGISFVGSTKVGKHIYSTAAANGKRVQALCEAKNHALVLRDCKLERTAQGIMNAYTGCAGQRCMALPVIVVEKRHRRRAGGPVGQPVQGGQAGQGLAARDRHGPGGQPGPHAIRAQLDKDRRGRGRDAGPGRPRPGGGRGLRKGLLHRPHHHRPRDRGHVLRPRGDLRPGAGGQAGGELRGRPHPDEQQPLRQWFGDLHPKRVLRPGSSPTARTRAWWG